MWAVRRMSSKTPMGEAMASQNAMTPEQKQNARHAGS